MGKIQFTDTHCPKNQQFVSHFIIRQHVEKRNKKYKWNNSMNNFWKV